MLTETDRFPYAVTPGWVRSVLQNGPAHWVGQDVQLPKHDGAFEALLPLLRHGVMERTDAPGAEAGLTSILRRSFENSSIKQFVVDARVISGANLSIRSERVRLQSEHALSARFCPPASKDVATSLAMALRYIEAALSRLEGDSVKTAICALLGSQILLTIHPFADGNGRTARMYFAAKVLRRIGPVPAAILGMMLIYRGGAHLYHLASWELRAGNVEPMVELFANSVALAHERFLQDGLTDQSSANFLAHSWRELQSLR